MGEGASSVLGPPRPPPHGRGGLPCFGTTDAAAAWPRGPLPLWDHQDPRRMGEGAYTVLGQPRPSPHVRGGFPCFGTTEALAACARGIPLFWDH